jgi:hypothetical protein
MIKSAAFLVVALLSATAVTIEEAIAQEAPEASPVTATGTASATATAGSSRSMTTLTRSGLPVTKTVDRSTVLQNGVRTTTVTTTTTEPDSIETPAVGNSTPVVLPSPSPVRPIGSPMRISPAGLPTSIPSR